LSHPGLYQIEIAQLREATAVMRALQIPTTNLPGVPTRLFSWAVNQLRPSLSQPFISRIAGTGRGQKMPSFHIDLHSRRGNSEVDYLNGAVVRFGQRAGVATPVNQWLNRMLLDITRLIGRISGLSRRTTAADSPVDHSTCEPGASSALP
jgi:2-dehydropantoate 2-reductase